MISTIVYALVILVIFILVAVIVFLWWIYTPPPPPLIVGSDFNSLYTRITDLINNVLTSSSGKPFPTDWPVGGTINNIDLKELVSEPGLQRARVNLGISTISVFYHYRLSRLTGLADAMKLSNLALTFSPDGRLDVSADLHADILVGIADIEVKEGAGIEISGICTDIPITLHNVNGRINMMLTSNCSSITGMNLNEFSLSFERLTIPCSIHIHTDEPLIDIDLNLDTFDTITSTVRSNLPRLREVFERVIRNALVGQSINLCTALSPPPTCLLGSTVTGNPLTYQIDLANTPSDRCIDICKQHPSCNYANSSPGACYLFQTIDNPIPIENAKGIGFGYDKATGAVVPARAWLSTRNRYTRDVIASPINGVDIDTCSYLCSLESLCGGYRHSNNTCNLLSTTGINPQRATFDLGVCSRNLTAPYTFV